MPDVLLNRLCELYGSPKPNAQAMSDDAKRETELLDRFLALYDVATLGEWFSKGKQWYRPIECPWASEHENPNEGTSTCIVYTEGGGYGFDCKHRCASKGWKEFRAELERRSERRFSFVGSETESVPFKEPTHENPSDPWAKYHTLDELLNVPPGRFIVDGILYDNSITALAGYAGDRKSIVSLNLAAACVTGKPFMGQFAVAHKPKRVIYLCPEMGLRELAKLSKTLGMLPYVGKTLFFRSLDKGGKIKLRDLTPSELDGSLVILDTAVRFIEGKENDPQDMAAFSDELFRLRNLGATVWVLFHSSKASVAQELSLQNAVRGSSEIAAMLSMCWATRLNDPAKRFESTSRMYPLKVREFEALPFDFGCDRATAACSIIGTPAPVAVLRTRKSDEKRLIIEELLKRDPDVGVNKIQAVLKERTGSGGNAKWVSDEKRLILAKLRGAGAVLVSA
ncbi:MAG TPA: AAA family ATPase [Terracidiphilus sp.]|nr:AAA family ATPase [Terracidiphilus sp.]